MYDSPSRHVRTPLLQRFVGASARQIQEHARRVPPATDAPLVSNVLEALGRMPARPAVQRSPNPVRR